jgi:hypothetical protein
VKNSPKKHWSNNAKWEITQALQYILLTTTKEDIYGPRFLAIYCDEVMTIDNQ